MSNKLPRHLWPAFEAEIAQSFRVNFAEMALRQSNIGDPRLICRAMLRAVYEVAFEKLEHREAVAMLAEALNELNSAHAKKEA